MSSYETLLESYAEEEKLSKITFEEMGNILESLTEFVNEEIQMTVEITLQEAEEGEVKDKENKFGASVKKTIDKLIEKLTAFIKKIGEAVKAFVAKAKMVVKQGGNVALSKALKNNNLVVKKEFTVVTTEYAKVGQLYNTAAKAAADVDAAVKKVNINTTPVEVPEVPASVANAIEAFSKRFEESGVVKKQVVEPGKKISEEYNSYVKPWLDQVNKGIENVEKVCKAAQKNASDIIKELKKNKDNQKAVNADGIVKVNKLSTAAMQISTNTVKFANSVLSIATKNSAKLALAAGVAAPGAAKDAVKTKAGEVKAAAKSKVQGAKADLDAKKAGMSGKNAGSIQKQAD